MKKKSVLPILVFSVLFHSFGNCFAQLPGSLTSGLVSYYTFEGNANDVVGGNNATNTGATLTNGVTGSPNSAYFFGAPGSHLIAAYSPATNNSFTWSLWINPLNHRNIEYYPLSSATIGFNGMSPSFTLSSSGAIGFYSYDDALSGEDNGLTNAIVTSVIIPTNSWTMLTVTSDTNNLRSLYVNGALITNKASSGYGQSFSNLIFGSERFLNPDQTLDGSLDDVAIYNRPLSPSEVTDLYNAQLVPEPSTYALLLLSGAASLWALKRRKS